METDCTIHTGSMFLLANTKPQTKKQNFLKTIHSDMFYKKSSILSLFLFLIFVNISYAHSYENGKGGSRIKISHVKKSITPDYQIQIADQQAWIENFKAEHPQYNYAAVMACNITGPLSVCPASTNQYCGPPGQSSYSWLIGSGGTIIGSSTSECVNVQAANNCNTLYTLVLVTNGTEVCFVTVDVIDNTSPVINSCPTGAALGCNPSIPSPDLAGFSASDNCGSVTKSSTDNTIISGCNRTLTRTYRATDACGNTSTCTQVFTYTVDVTAPVITACPAGGALGCNPIVPPADLNSFSATDACGSITKSVSADVTTNLGCDYTTSRVYTATDACGNTATCEQVFTYVVDVDGPIITSCPAGGALPCNTSTVPPADLSAFVVSDACSAVNKSVSADNVSTSGCTTTVSRIYTATDACGNTSTCEQVFTYTFDNEVPVVVSCPAGGDLGCNPASIPSADLGAFDVTDDCSSIVESVSADVTTNVGCAYTTSRVYTATDGCGNTATCEQVFTYTIDVDAPTITACPAGGALGCNPVVPSADLGAFDATDACGAVTESVSADVTTNIGCAYTTSRVYTATDACGNTATCEQVFTYTIDVDAPTITACPAGGALGCNPASIPAADLGLFSATDACGAVTESVSADQTTNVGCVFTTSRVYTATDACGNSSTCAQVFTYTVDVDAPVITACPPGGALGCNPVVPAADLGDFDATDACGAVTESVSADVTTNIGCAYTTTRIYTATDACGNTATCEQVFTYTIDVDAPTITACPAGGALGCNPASIPAADLGAFDATDACGAVTETVSADVTTNVGCAFTTSRVYTATDACGNTATCEQVFTYMVDVDAPVITACPAGGALGCNPASIPAADLGGFDATDACGAVTESVSADITTNTGCNFTTSRIYTATDACGNTATCEQVFTYTIDVDAPTITACPAGGALGCNPVVPSADLGAFDATDVCGAVTESVSADVTTNIGCAYTTTRIYTATDACGNTATCAQVFTYTIDTDAPTITACPAGGALGCNPASIPAADLGSFSATDACGAVTESVSADVTTNTGCEYTTSRVYTATDACGNSSTCAQVFTYTVDVDAPVITACPPGGALGCNPVIPTADLGDFDATDACGAVTESVSADVTTNIGCAYTTTRIYTATDACGNTATCEQVFTYTIDVDAPTITACPASGALGCNPASIPSADLGAFNATDACGAVAESVSADITTNVGCAYTTSRIYTATDGCGNTATCAQVFTYTVDVDVPTITACPAGGALGCNPASIPAADLGSFSATDACGAVTESVSADVTTNVGCDYITSRVYTATDGCGNTATCEQVFTYTIDVDAPTITACPAGGALGCNPVVPSADLGAFDATDACGAVTESVSADVTTNIGCAYTTTRIYTASDACGNTSTCSQVFTYTIDTDAPTITACPAGGALGCNPASIPAADLGAFDATDACGSVTESVSADQTTNVGCLFTTSRVYTATDACGNSTTCAEVYTYTIDITNPIITSCPTGGALGCNPILPAADLGAFDATDDCGVVIESVSADVTTNIGCAYTTSRVYTATDACGNTATCEQVFTYTIDVDAPTITACPAGGALGCNPVIPPANLMGFSATDACGFVIEAVSADVTSNVGCAYTTSRIYTATDGCGNTATCAQVFTYTVDVDAPIITACPASGALGCNPASIPAADLGSFSATDACGAVTESVSADVTTNVGCDYTTSRVYTATDACGNTATCEQVFTYTIDVDAPTITACPAGGALGCNPVVPSADLGAFDATDACGAVTESVSADVTTNIGCAYTTTRIYTATDACGNTTTCAQVFTYTIDTDAPTITACPAGGALGCNPVSIPAADLGAFDANDACGAVTESVSADVTTNIGCAYTTSRIYTATDACGNIATCVEVFTYTIDISSPVIDSCPVSGALGCNPVVPSADLNSFVVTDNCGAPVKSVSADVTTNVGCAYTTSRVYTATDACGNTATCEQVFTYTIDVDAPVITECPAGGALGCNPTIPGADLGSFSATDACGAVTESVSADITTNVGCAYTTTRIYTATDACGNTATCAQVFTYTVDVDAPVITACPAGGALGCNPASVPAADLGAFDASDACGSVTESVSADVIVNTGCNYTVSRIYTATDACGNTATCEQVYTYTLDVTSPVITSCPAGATLGCNPTIPAPDFATFAATDACGVVNESTLPDNIIVNGCDRIHIRTYVATDACGNSSSCVQVFLYKVDTIAPTIIACPAGGALGCNPASIPASDLNQLSATDACVTINKSVGPDVIVANGCDYTLTRVYTASDDCGNASTCEQVFTYTIDTIAPTIIVCPAGGALGCNPVLPVADLNAFVVIDACVTVNKSVSADVTTNIGCEYTTSRVYTAEDGCGNTATCEQVFTYTIDVESPLIITCPAGDSFGCNPVIPAADLAGFTATDNCGAVSTSVSGDIITNSACEYTLTRIYTAVDGCGNSTTCAQVFTYTLDTIAPVIVSCPAGGSLGCNPVVPAADTAAFVVTDACGNIIKTVSPDLITPVGCTRVLVRTYTATDACGNSASCVQVFIYTVDITPPTITECPAGGALGCNPVIPPADLGDFSATDACVTITESVSADVITNVGCDYTLTRIYTATDGCGNTATCAQVFTYTIDTIAPAIMACPAGGALGCNPVVPVADLSSFLVSDDCDNVITSVGSDVTTNVGCEYTTTRIYTATDACGNTATCSQEFTYTIDVDNPIIVDCPAGGALGCNPIIPLADLGAFSATDACGAISESVSADVTTNVGCEYITTRIYTASDACGNSATCEQVFTYTVDTIAPNVNECPGDEDLGCNPSSIPAPDLFTFSVSDDCGAVSKSVSPDVIINTGCGYTISRIYTATDGCGNTATCEQIITYQQDSIAPIIIACPPGGNLGCNPSIPLADLNAFEVFDACGTITKDVSSDNISNSGCNYILTRIYTATDGCGNTATCEQLFTYTADTDAPVISACPAGGALGCNPVIPAADLNAFESSDACGTITESFSADITTNNGCDYTTSRIYTATDACGNTATCEQVFTYTVDIDAPVVTACPPGDELGCNPVIPAPDLNAFEASDACGAIVKSVGPDVLVVAGCTRTLTRIYTATDACGNTATCAQTFTYIVDVSAPVITACPAGGSLGCNPVIPAADLSAFFASDSCGLITKSVSADVTTNVGCEYTTSRVYTATDGCGNTSTCEQVFTYTIDLIAPVITACPAGSSLGCNPVIPAPDFTAFTATDACGSVTESVSADSITVNGCDRILSRIYTATDGCGNTATCVQVFLYTVDVTAPVITSCPAGGALGCNPVLPAADLNALIANDNCITITKSVSADVTTNVGCQYTTSRVYTVTDGCGNTASCEQVFTYTIDVTAPVIAACPSGGALGCNPVVPAADLNAFETSDACGVVTESVSADVTTNVGCEFTTSRVYTVTDACGNTATCEQVFTYTVDLVAPIISACPAGGALGCNPVIPAADLNAFETSDACGTVTESVSADVTTNVGCEYTTSRVYTVTDGCGNTASCEQVFTYTIDLSAPTIELCPAGGDIGCNATPPAADLNAFVVFDDCGTVTKSVSADSLNTVDCVTTLTRIYTATDACGNTATCAQVFTYIGDAIAPEIIECPAGGDLGCNPVSIPVADIEAFVVTDQCTSVTKTVSADNIVTDGCDNTLTRIYTATDGCGNTATCAQIFTYTIDVTAPSLTCSGDITVSCSSGVPAADISSVSVSDNCSGTVVVTHVGDVVSGQTCDNNFIVTRTYLATDACGNTSTCVQSITVSDQTAPTITCPAAVTVSCSALVPAPNVNSVTATDNCAGTVTVNFVSDVISAQTCTNRYIVTRTYSATDVCGNVATCTQIITVNDQTAPSITCPANVTVSCASQVPVINESSVITSDNCGGTVTVIFVSQVISNQTCANRFTLTRVYRATDECGNSATCSQIITVNDVTAPVITCPAGITVSCGGTIPAPNVASVTATDGCSGTVTVTHISDVNTGVGCANGFSVIRTYRATDACGNTADCTQLITVSDQVAPTISCPGALFVSCAGAIQVPDPGSVVATDNCGGSVTVTFVSDVNTNQLCANKFTLIRTYRATDACGNTAECTQTIFVNDVSAPVISGVPANITVSCDAPIPSVPTVTASDNCGGTVNLSYTETSTQSPWLQLCQAYTYNITRKWVATDACGNTSSKVQVISVKDLEAPIFASVPPAFITVQCDEDNNNNVDPVPVDACDATPAMILDIEYEPNLNGCVNSYTAIYTWTAGDNCGNLVQYTQHISVVDTEAPEMECPQNILVESDAPIVVTWATPTSEDFCEGSLTPVQVAGPPSGTEFKPGTQTTITYSVVDACGNESTCSFTVTIKGKIINKPLKASGVITNANNQTIENTVVSLNTNTVQTTLANGKYSFSNIASGSNIEVKPTKKDNPLNGVNTLDLVYITNHILGKKFLDSPFKLLAADVNNNGSVTTADLVQLRKLILHITDVFPDKDSWTFIPEETTFTDPENPFKEAKNSSKKFKNVIEDVTANFKGIKTGDVNLNASAKANGANEVRSSENLLLTAENVKFNKGDIVSLKISAKDISDIKGAQFTLEFESDLLEFTGINSSIFTEDNFGLRFLENGKITASLDIEEAPGVNELVTVQFEAKENGELNKLITITSSLTPAQAYTSKDETIDVKLQFTHGGNEIVETTPVLYQNEPNPFDSYTRIRFTLPADQSAKITVYDMEGREVTAFEGNYNKGMNEIQISESEFPSAGMYMYELKTENFTETRRMIYIK